MDVYKTIETHSKNLALARTEICSLSFFPGDIYWVKKTGKKIKLFNAGSFLIKEKLESYLDKKMDLEINLTVNGRVVDEISNLFKDLLAIESHILDREKRKAAWRKEFIKTSFRCLGTDEKFWFGNIGFIFEDWIKELPLEIQKILITSKENFQQKALTSAGICVFIAVWIGYLDYKFLKELFWGMIFSQIDLMSDSPSSEVENLIDKNSKDLNYSFSDIEENHSSLSVEKYNEICENKNSILEKVVVENISSKKIKKCIQYKYEKSNGKGLYKTFGIELTDLEVLFNMTLRFFPIIDYSYSKVSHFFEKFQEHLSGSIGGQRIGYLLKRELLEIEHHNEEYLEVSGL